MFAPVNSTCEGRMQSSQLKRCRSDTRSSPVRAFRITRDRVKPCPTKLDPVGWATAPATVRLPDSAQTHRHNTRSEWLISVLQRRNGVSSLSCLWKLWRSSLGLGFSHRRDSLDRDMDMEPPVCMVTNLNRAVTTRSPPLRGPFASRYTILPKMLFSTPPSIEHAPGTPIFSVWVWHCGRATSLC